LIDIEELGGIEKERKRIGWGKKTSTPGEVVEGKKVPGGVDNGTPE